MIFVQGKLRDIVNTFLEVQKNKRILISKSEVQGIDGKFFDRRLICDDQYGSFYFDEQN